MIETPQVTSLASQPIAFIHLTIPKDQIQHEMGPGIQELMGTVTKQGIKPTGCWFTHHHKMMPDSWDFEICVPVSLAVTAEGRVKPGQRPAIKVAKTVYQGGYEGLGEAWSEFIDWIEANGHKPAADLYESYVAGPESGSDPAKWRTELMRPLVG